MAIEIYPVVHVKDEVQATSEGCMALELGADGVFLIGHGGGVSSDLVMRSFNWLDCQKPDSFIGMNLLEQLTAYHSLVTFKTMQRLGVIGRLPSGLWVDDAWTANSHGTEIRRTYPDLADVKYFGGVAFKYTAHYTDSPTEAARQAGVIQPMVDVVTTSGVGTGEAPNLPKIRAIKRAISKPLAVASGISAANLEAYKSHLDMVLVSSSIETAPYSGHFDETKLAELIAIAHA